MLGVYPLLQLPPWFFFHCRTLFWRFFFHIRCSLIPCKLHPLRAVVIPSAAAVLAFIRSAA
jgi:hypothetical protein